MGHFSLLHDKIKKKFFAKDIMMKRTEQRLLKKAEKEPVKVLMESQKHYYPKLQQRLNEIKDPRDKRYTIYNCSTMIGTGMTKNICGISSMQQMTANFNEENTIQNISKFVGNENEELPHYVTLNDFLERLETSELQKVRKDMRDVHEAIQNLIYIIREEYARSSSQLNLSCFKGILTQDFEMVDSIPEEYIDPECIEMIFNSVSENELLDADKVQIKEKLISVIEKETGYDEYDKIVIYYYNMLISRYESLKKIEDKLEHFFYACNQYLSSKEFVYKPNDFEYAIYVQSRDGSKKKMSIEQLSSGEKQIVALFSYIYLFITEPCMVIIDEPELSLSITWQEKILEDIVQSKNCNNLIVATQSPFVYDNSLREYARTIEEFLVLE